VEKRVFTYPDGSIEDWFYCLDIWHDGLHIHLSGHVLDLIFSFTDTSRYIPAYNHDWRVPWSSSRYTDVSGIRFHFILSSKRIRIAKVYKLQIQKLGYSWLVHLILRCDVSLQVSMR
jgi:hypothetical protein